MQKDDPKALLQAKKLLSVLPHINPKEKDFPFVECASLADDIKYRGGSWQSDWHFVDKPWLDQGGKPEDYPEFVNNWKNLTMAIPQIVDWLRLQNGYKDSYVYQTMIKRNFTSLSMDTLMTEESNSKNQEEQNDIKGRSYALRLLIHYLGDIHQPLHCSSRVDKKFPSGDKGGNMFPIPFHYTESDLHGVWDSVLYHYHDYIKLVRSIISFNF